MIGAADWRLTLVVGGAAGLLAAPFWDPGSEWLRSVLAAGLVAVCLVDRGQVRLPGVLLIGLAAALSGLMVGNARLDAIDARALDMPPGPVTSVN